jgi:hypothetical protein
VPVRVTGLRETTRALERFGAEVADLKDVFGEIAAEGARLASSFAPKDSGRLQGSIRGNRAKNKAIVRAGGARVRYAGPINYGWPARDIAGARFMAKADAALADRAVTMLENGLDQLIRKVDLG